METYFPYKFSPTLPLRHMKNVPPDQVQTALADFPGEGQTFSVLISHLSHSTHDENVRSIENGQGTFTFQVYKKNPRENSRKYDITTDTLLSIPASQTMLPGYLTWWGIDIIPWYDSDDEEGACARIKESKLRNGEAGQCRQALKRPHICQRESKIYLARYLQYFDGRGSSVYGGNSYTFPLKKLIESYKESRRDVRLEDERKVYLKKAGTLLYWNEICYVILVCMGKELISNADIRKMEGASQPDEVNGRQVTYFQSNGFIGPDGEVIDMTQECIYFNSEYPIKALYNSGSKPKHYNWDMLSFAFYYPRKSGRLQIHEPGYHRNYHVRHDRRSCHLKVASKECPDQRRD